MIKSMTGYGVGTSNVLGGRYVVEIKSLNSKFLELGLKLPRKLNDKEFLIRTEVAKRLERGKVMFSVGLEKNSQEKNLENWSFKSDLVALYYERMRTLAQEYGEPTENILPSIASLPMMMEQVEEVLNEEEWLSVWQAIELAFHSFDEFRLQEGKALSEDISLRIKTILNILESVEQFEGQRLSTIRERILKMIEEHVGTEYIDKNRFEQELIYYVEKLDVTEEKVRLRNHCQYFLDTLQDTSSNGKKLGFIVQEIGREINTLGSKANNAQMQHMVVCMKDELEKMKEQLLNIL